MVVVDDSNLHLDTQPFNWLGLRVGGYLALSLHSSNEPMYAQNDTVINSDVGIVIRPHRSSTYIDVAYCYRPSSVVCQSICHNRPVVSPVKTAQPVMMLFGLGLK